VLVLAVDGSEPGVRLVAAARLDLVRAAAW
jgi:hypothetical protein